MNEMLSDSRKFKKFGKKPGKRLIICYNKKIGSLIFLKKTKRSISGQLYKELYPRASQPGIMYGLSKIYKPFIKKFSKTASYTFSF